MTMHKVIAVELTGQAHRLHLQEDAYDALRAYLDQARSRLSADPDAAEVIDDLERSIGERLGAMAETPDRVFEKADIDAVLEDVGTVEAGAAAPSQATPAAPAPVAATAGPRSAHRRLYRIREDQRIAGVCTGLAAYADLGVDWVRTIMVLLTIVTAGLFGLVYLLLMFVLPVLPTRDDWEAAMEQAGRAGTP
jgi:phage shock protein C